MNSHIQIIIMIMMMMRMMMIIISNNSNRSNDNNNNKNIVFILFEIAAGSNKSKAIKHIQMNPYKSCLHVSLQEHILYIYYISTIIGLLQWPMDRCRMLICVCMCMWLSWDMFSRPLSLSLCLSWTHSVARSAALTAKVIGWAVSVCDP